MPRGEFKLICRMVGLAIARHANQGFHVIEVTLERTSSRSRETILRLRHPALERFSARDILGFFQLARMHTEISVSGAHQLFQVAEAERVVHCKRAHNSKTQSLVNETIELLRFFRG